MTPTMPITPVAMGFIGLYGIGLVILLKRYTEGEPSNWSLAGALGTATLFGLASTVVFLAYFPAPWLIAWVVALTVAVVGLVRVA